MLPRPPHWVPRQGTVCRSVGGLIIGLFSDSKCHPSSPTMPLSAGSVMMGGWGGVAWETGLIFTKQGPGLIRVNYKEAGLKSGTTEWGLPDRRLMGN